MKIWRVKFRQGSLSGNYTMRKNLFTKDIEMEDMSTIEDVRIFFDNELVNKMYRNKFVSAEIKGD